MTFEWDARKAAVNPRKHKITFEQADTAFRDPGAMTFADPDHCGEELREITIGHTEEGYLLFISHCERDDRMRIISARAVTAGERRQYEEGSESQIH